MIEKTITTLFGNLVSIQGKYVDQAVNKRVDLKVKLYLINFLVR